MEPRSKHVLLALLVMLLIGTVLRCRRRPNADPSEVRLHRKSLGTWWVLAGVVSLAMWLGEPGITALFAVVSVLAFRELVRLIAVRRADQKPVLLLHLAILATYLSIVTQWTLAVSLCIPAIAICGICTLAVLTLDRAVIVALNSTALRRSIVGGRIQRKQLEFCAAAFESAPADALRVIVALHHFATAPDYERDQAMPKARRAIERFTDLGVDLILGGHLHRSYIGDSLDLYPSPGTNRGIVIVQCGTTTSRRGRAREREKNSLNLIRYQTISLEVVHYVLFEDEQEFRPVSQHRFPSRGTSVLPLPSADVRPPSGSRRPQHG